MNKAFPLIIVVFAVGIILYALPEFAAYFGLQAFNPNSLSAVVFVSGDNGKTFSQTYWSDVAAPAVYGFSQDSRNSSFVYAATSRGLFMSRDKGSHWYKYADLEGQLANAAVYQIQSVDNNPGRFFVSLFKNGQGGVYETTDRFFTLKKIFDAKEAGVYKLASSGGNLYLGLSDGRLIGYSLADSGFKLLASVGSPITDVVAKGANVYVATRAKQVWAGTSAGSDFALLSDRQPSQSAYTASLLGAELNTIVPKNPIKTIQPSGDGGIYLAAADKLYRSLNAGRNWQLILDIPGRQISALDFGAGRVLVGTEDRSGSDSL